MQFTLSEEVDLKLKKLSEKVEGGNGDASPDLLLSVMSAGADEKLREVESANSDRIDEIEVRIDQLESTVKAGFAEIIEELRAASSSEVVQKK